jgi:uncharacterized membrane protein YkvI
MTIIDIDNHYHLDLNYILSFFEIQHIILYTLMSSLAAALVLELAHTLNHEEYQFFIDDPFQMYLNVHLESLEITTALDAN